MPISNFSHSIPSHLLPFSVGKFPIIHDKLHPPSGISIKPEREKNQKIESAVHHFEHSCSCARSLAGEHCFILQGNDNWRKKNLGISPHFLCTRQCRISRDFLFRRHRRFLSIHQSAGPFIRVRILRIAFCSGPKTAVNVPHGEILFRANKNKTKYS